MIIFSKVTLKSDTTNDTTTGLVSGIPRAYSDLEGWKLVDEFLTEQDAESSLITVEVEVYGYGEGNTYAATVEEVAYMYNRLQMRPDFLESRCTLITKNVFTFDWTPAELW